MNQWWVAGSPGSRWGGLEFDWYSRLFKAATGMDLNLANMADRIYALIRAFWIREYGGGGAGSMTTRQEVVRATPNQGTAEGR